jgi:hypothetical protein
MGAIRTVLAAAAAMLSFATVAETAGAQALPGSNPQQRECQTVRTCEFRRDAPVRGCLSSYSCRSCALVRVPCALGGRTSCQEMRCNWGG